MDPAAGRVLFADFARTWLEAQPILRRAVLSRHQLVSVPGVAAHLGPPKTASSLRTVPAPAFVLEALAEHIRLFPAGPFGMIFSNTRRSFVNR